MGKCGIAAFSIGRKTAEMFWNTFMQGLLCYKGFVAQLIRCPIAGVLLFGLDAVLVILNIMYPAGVVTPA